MEESELIENMNVFARRIFLGFDHQRKFIEEFEALFLHEKYAVIAWIVKRCMFNEKENVEIIVEAILLSFFAGNKEKAAEFLTEAVRIKRLATSVLLNALERSSFGQSLQ